MKKKILIIVGVVVLIYSLFIIEESTRLKMNINSKPLIVIDKVFCSEDDFICYGEDRTYNEEYLSLGFVLKIKYYLDEKSSNDNIIYHTVEEEFLLFNKFRLWSWITDVNTNSNDNFELIDKTKEISDFSCASALEPFYTDDNYTYSWNCIKNEYMIIKYENGDEELISDALKKWKIKITDLDKYNISYYKVNNNTTEIDKREKLKLSDYRNNSIYLNLEEDELLEVKNINLNHIVMNERVDSLYNNEKELDSLVKYIKDELNVEINNRWKVFIHYYTSDKSSGMVEFIYTIGDIDTNRTIVFNIDDDKYDTVYYKCLTGKIDEEDLINRLSIFKNKYVQEKRKLKDGETFHDEHTNYIYYINVDTLVYSYSYFFTYDMGIINNDWGTTCIIDENGNAINAK